MANEGFPTTQPYSRDGLLAKLTGAATLAAGALFYGAGTSQLATLATPAVSGSTRYALSHPGGAVAPSWSTSAAWQDQANTFTAAQTINSTGGTISGFNAARAGSVLNLYGDGTNAVRISSFCANATAGAAFTQDCWKSRGSGTTPTATQQDDQFWTVNCNGYGSAWSTANRGAMSICAAENWTSAAQGTYWQLSLTTIGTTTTTIFARAFGDASWQIGGTPSTTTAGWGGGLSIGGIGTSGNGLLQLASGTTKAYGIAFGTDTFIHRISIGAINLAGGGTSKIWLGLDDTNGPYIGSSTTHPFRITANGTTAITIDTSQNASFAGDVTIASGKALRLGSTYAAGAPTVTGYITIKDATGTSYKVAVGT